MNDYKGPQRKSNSGRIWVGLIIIIIGFSMLTKTLGFMFHFPNWLFSWPMWLIVIGLIIGAKNNFKKPASFVLIFIGCFFLTERVADISLGRFFWPMFIIILGCWLIAGRNKRNNYFSPNDPPRDPLNEDKDDYTNYGTDHNYGNEMDWDKRVDDPTLANEPTEEETTSNGFHEKRTHYSNKYPEDFIDSVSVFGQVKKNIYSKNFKGGDVVNIMGGADINLMQADIQQPVILEVVQIFGGTTIIVPAHWKVNPEMTAIFGGVEDKRFVNNIAVDNHKNLIIRGTSIFGGITVKSI
ncbi:hypothetical protein H8S90_12685 [Olivibacter sp. SDN3]|uniref:LiaF transmembrane domain-containing protein n=1 Tax=Olivibacter sp. SDN3 TaxID=2764720 RepID=UPI0016517298|nr:LiaF domain-containing protein [Olivibacter sp. SDN3]QNL47687.1 hypothetical protein H8S90_12685 [Olivibacter sp. SDN3]